jgi:hypothetical protein
MKGDLDGAISSFKQVLSLDPKHALAHRALNHALQQKKRDGGGL